MNATTGEFQIARKMLAAQLSEANGYAASALEQLLYGDKTMAGEQRQIRYFKSLILIMRGRGLASIAATYPLTAQQQQPQPQSPVTGVRDRPLGTTASGFPLPHTLPLASSGLASSYHGVKGPSPSLHHPPPPPPLHSFLPLQRSRMQPLPPSTASSLNLSSLSSSFPVSSTFSSSFSVSASMPQPRSTSFRVSSSLPSSSHPSSSVPAYRLTHPSAMTSTASSSLPLPFTTSSLSSSSSSTTFGSRPVPPPESCSSLPPEGEEGNTQDEKERSEGSGEVGEEHSSMDQHEVKSGKSEGMRRKREKLGQKDKQKKEGGEEEVGEEQEGEQEEVYSSGAWPSVMPLKPESSSQSTSQSNFETNVLPPPTSSSSSSFFKSSIPRAPRPYPPPPPSVVATTHFLSPKALPSFAPSAPASASASSSGVRGKASSTSRSSNQKRATVRITPQDLLNYIDAEKRGIAPAWTWRSSSSSSSPPSDQPRHSSKSTPPSSSSTATTTTTTSVVDAKSLSSPPVSLTGEGSFNASDRAVASSSFPSSSFSSSFSSSMAPRSGGMSRPSAVAGQAASLSLPFPSIAVSSVPMTTSDALPTALSWRDQDVSRLSSSLSSANLVDLPTAVALPYSVPSSSSLSAALSPNRVTSQPSVSHPLSSPVQIVSPANHLGGLDVNSVARGQGSQGRSEDLGDLTSSFFPPSFSPSRNHK